jgi:hypothetical protein
LNLSKFKIINRIWNNIFYNKIADYNCKIVWNCFVAAFGPQTAATGGTTLFGTQPQSAAAGMFGQTNKPLFGTATIKHTILPKAEM